MALISFDASPTSWASVDAFAQILAHHAIHNVSVIDPNQGCSTQHQPQCFA